MKSRPARSLDCAAWPRLKVAFERRRGVLKDFAKAGERNSKARPTSLKRGAIGTTSRYSASKMGRVRSDSSLGYVPEASRVLYSAQQGRI